MQFCIKRVIKKLDETIRGGGITFLDMRGMILFSFIENTVSKTLI